MIHVPPVAAVRPLLLIAAVAVLGLLLVRRRKLGRIELAAYIVVAVGCTAVGIGLVEPPNIEKLIEDAGQALGKWTYLLVGALAFLETGAFIGLIAPGETAVIVGGVVAGQGQTDVLVMIGIVWACAVAGDVTSYFLGRRLGRGFMLEYGPRVKITHERLEQVEEFFDRRGGVTILVGRFIGLVRAIAPFVAGASRMPMRKFLPYDVLGAGLWATTFTLLGYIFWRSFDTVTAYVGRGLFLFGTIVAIVLAVLWVRRVMRDAAYRAQVNEWLERQEGHPARRPFVRAARWTWRRLVRPAVRLASGPWRFLYDRVTPGELGLQLTTLLALGAVGTYLFFAMAWALDERALLPGDAQAFSIADALYTPFTADLAGVLTDVGSLPVVAVAVVAVAGWAIRRRRAVDAAALVTGLALTYAAVHVAKNAVDRPRPTGSSIDTVGSSYPSAHAAYAVAFVACAVVLVRGGSSLALRFASVTVAVVIAVCVALSRVYLRAHHLSDAIGGAALAVAVFALCGTVALTVEHVRHNEPRRR